MDDLFDPVYTSPGLTTGEGCIVVKHMKPSALSGSESISADDLKQFLMPGGQFQVSTQAIETGKHRAIIITKVKLSSAFEDLIRSENERGLFIIEHFLEKELGFNITKHALVPQHEKLSPDQKRELLRRCTFRSSISSSTLRLDFLTATSCSGTSWQRVIFLGFTNQTPSPAILACKRETFFELSGPQKLPAVMSLTE
jgi:hypothetical protein